MSSKLTLCLALLCLTACGEEPTPSHHPAAQAADPQAAPAVAPTPTSATTTADGACPWLDATLATGLLGADVTVTAVEAGSCRIASEPPTYRGRLFVGEVSPDETALSPAEAAMANFVAEPSSRAPEAISGLGEEAMWVAQGAESGGDARGMLRAEQSGRVLVLALQPEAPRADLRDRAVALARAVLSNV